ncbi:MAG: rhamnogalacturonan lyase, partial [Candidatus Ornithomonoglobus sp.]
MKKQLSALLAAAMAVTSMGIVPVTVSADGAATVEISYNYDGQDHTRQMEKLDRGLVAVKTDDGVFLSWRLNGDEASVGDIAGAPDFKVYKNGTLIATVDNSTNYLDKSGTVSDSYTVAPEGGEQCGAVTPMDNSYFDIPLEKPADFAADEETSYAYAAGDASCGDLDGDGEYEIVIKWDANPQDNSIAGITGNVYLDAYKLDGTRLWRIDLGRNIRGGAHYTQFLVYDFDLDGRAEITCKTAPGSIDGKGEYVSAASADSTIRSVDNTVSYVNDGGYVIEGPEYFTIFDGETGAAIDTINYPVQRVSASVWGDSYGNRCDRFVADVSYMDGEKPYAVYWRGYYFGQSGYGERTGVFAASFDGERLSVPENHIFDTRSDQPGYRSGNEIYVGEGNHNMTTADVDDDGRDEVISGALCLEFDDNDTLSPKWCTFKEHGDALHIGDYDPTHQGLEFFTVHEDGGGVNIYGGVTLDYGASVIDPATGEIMKHWSASKDTGRGLMANVGAGGYYQITAAAGINGWYCLGGSSFESGPTIGQNFRVFWDGDLYDEALDGTTISAWNGAAMSTVFTADGCVSINGTKATPALQADLFGDWREEVAYPLTDSSALRIFTTTDITEYKLPTLMHDPVYRSGVASEQSAYNQPPHI